MSFSFEDFLLYTKAPEIDVKMFSTLAPGVLEYVKDTYGIYLENSSAEVVNYIPITSNNFVLPFSPINSISTITQDSVELPYTYYGEDIELTTSLTDLRIPLVITLDVGFTTVPADLKMAVYLHIESAYFRAKNSSDNITKVVNSTGSTTFFREHATPKTSEIIYNKYSDRLIAYY